MIINRPAKPLKKFIDNLGGRSGLKFNNVEVRQTLQIVFGMMIDIHEATLGASKQAEPIVKASPTRITTIEGENEIILADKKIGLKGK